MAKFTNRGIVILYQGMSLTEDVEKAILKVIAPFVHNNAKADVFQINANDLALAAAGQSSKVSGATIINFAKTEPEQKAADLIGISFGDVLKSNNSIRIAITLNGIVQKIKADPSDSSIALIRALKLATKPEFQIKVGIDTLSKYNIDSNTIRIIRDVLDANDIPHE